MTFPNAHPLLQTALTARGYSEPTTVQLAVLEADPARDLLVSAQTGSGKTVAFGLAAAGALLGEAEALPPAGKPLALVIAPTRELALQVREELNWLYAAAGARTVSCVGGMDPKRERSALAQGCHIVIGTPGRLRDHLERGQLDVGALRIVVLDEADEMLDLGFREDLEFILRTVPAARRTLLFSATIAKGIAGLARSFQRDALRIDTARSSEPHGDIDYRALRIAPGETLQATVNVLRFHDSPGVLVFCATREAVRRMHASLLERGFAAAALSGELSQAERSRALSGLRDGRTRVCVATDVAARGLDLPSLDLVIHAELPGSREALLHRSGRTGRAGRKGVCVVLVPADRHRRAQALFAAAGINPTWEKAPSVEAIRARDDQRLLADTALDEPIREDELALARTFMEQRPAEALVAALLRLVRARLPAPEELTDTGSGPRARGETGGARSNDAGRAPGGQMAMFRLRLGRRNKADPKWLLPLICRLGDVGRQDIGRIRIGESETTFEVAEAAEAHFIASLATANEHEARIEPMTGGAPALPAGTRPKRQDARKPAPHYLKKRKRADKG